MELCVLLVENVNLVVATPRPGHDLVLISLKHDDRRVSKSGTTDSGIGIIGHTMEVTKHDVIRDGVRQGVGVLIDVTRCVRD